MTIELSPEEVEEISLWYRSCCNESQTSCSLLMFALLEKLDIAAEPLDLYIGQFDKAEEVQAKKAYLSRHPEIDRVAMGLSE